MSEDATTALLRALSAQLNGVKLTVEEARSRNWASATYTGVRHALRLRLDGMEAAAAADRFLEGLEEREFDLRGHILADIALVSRENSAGGDRVQISLEALTVEAD